MSADEPQGLVIDLPKYKKKFVFNTPVELRRWLEDWNQKLDWLRGTSLDFVWNRLQSPLQDIRNTLDQWSIYSKHLENIPHWQSEVHSALNRLYSDEVSLLKDDDAMAFVLGIVREYGPIAAAGAYAALTKCSIPFDGNTNGAFFNGLIQGFLFLNEIKWTATSHRTLLTELESDLKQHIDDQSKRLKVLESENKTINDAHNSILEEKAQLLDELHQKQIEAFDEVLKTHKENFKATEDAFHNKLALSKPIDYWKTKRENHKKLTSRFAWSSSLSFIAFAGLLSWVVHWSLGNLGATENPKHWQIGVVIVTAFFAVWIIRIQVRFLFSNQHLASDADERVTMVQTYLSLLQEGKGVETNDRALIVQQLFRPASDGIVKDDAAPPGFFELASRQK